MSEMDACSQTDTADDDRRLEERLSKIGKVFVVLSGKGGVGKSTVAVNLAMSLSMQGFRTGLLDADIHGPSIPKLLHLSGHGLTGSNDGIIPLQCYVGLKVMSMGLLLPDDDQPIIWRGPMKGNAIKQLFQDIAWGELDYLVVDCPPGTGDEPLSVAQYVKGRSAGVIVTTPQEVATVDVAKCIVFCNQLGMPIAGIVENMSGYVCPKCGEQVDIFSSGGGERLAGRLGVPFLGRIAIDPAIVKSGDEGLPYIYSFPETGTAARFAEIVATITENGRRCGDA
jgi:Mrp family chromosome partitioning ATPase